MAVNKNNHAHLVGKRFGRLLVLRVYNGGSGVGIKCSCQCDCGKQHETYARGLVRGVGRSCGCLTREKTVARETTHGLYYTPEMRVWRKMIARCHNPKRKVYKNYGARGIKVCERWRSSIANFYADMGPRPSPKHEIERINNDGDYCPENCRWATHKEQSRNKRTNRRITSRGVTRILVEWEEITGIRHETIARRIDKMGWTPEKALETPPRPPRPKGSKVVK
jgi:hypothetical protein